jgi:hypothetical protein
MRRAFSTTARTLLQFLWKGTTADPEYENMLKEKLSRNAKLVEADKVEIAWALRS